MSWQGAEAKVTVIEYGDKKAVKKDRFIKTYRAPELDIWLTKKRIKQEARNINRCKKGGANVPEFYKLNLNERFILMEYIEHKYDVQNYIKQNKNIEEISFLIGDAIASIHLIGVIHGDLTTSNMLIKDSDELNIYLIDFGLSFFSVSAEDRAVDLYVFERSLIVNLASNQDLCDQILKLVLKQYKIRLEKVSCKHDVLKKYEEVRMRGRKKINFG